MIKKVKDPDVACIDDFEVIKLLGQGGFGIMTSPAASRAAAGLITNGRLPDDLEALGLRLEMLSPERL